MEINNIAKVNYKMNDCSHETMSNCTSTTIKTENCISREMCNILKNINIQQEKINQLLYLVMLKIKKFFCSCDYNTSDWVAVNAREAIALNSTAYYQSLIFDIFASLHN